MSNHSWGLQSRIQYAYMAGTIVFTVYGQLVIKWRLRRYGSIPPEFGEKVQFLCGVLLDPYVVSGLAAGFMASLFWIAAMSIADVSFAYPFISAGLLLLTVTLAVLFFGEPMTLAKSAGITLIVAGVLAMAAN